MLKVIDVAIVEDHTLFREGFKCLLEMKQSARVVAEASTAEEALAIVAQVPCDVMVIDISLPGKNGIWCIRAVKERLPALPVLVLSMHSDEHVVVEALRAGANGYVLKSASYAEVARALRSVYDGGAYVTPQVVGHMVSELHSSKRPAQHDDLTGREMDVLELLARGLSNHDMAEQVCLSEVTVKSHLRSLYRKLSVSDRTQAVLEGMRRRLLHVEENPSPLDMLAPQQDFKPRRARQPPLTGQSDEKSAHA